MPNKLYVAIGDIHGELQRLKSLHGKARAYANENHPELELVFVHLGDLIDRGPDSCGVIEYLISLHAQAPETITVKGNHEQMMLDSYPEGEPKLDSFWLRWGGTETLDSYTARQMERPPKAHLDWVDALPAIVEITSRKLVFVHAGVHPEQYPNCTAQVHLWTRKTDFHDPGNWSAEGLQGATVVHGHTPTHDNLPDVTESTNGLRVNVDTGAVFGGALTGAVLAPGKDMVFLHA